MADNPMTRRLPSLREHLGADPSGEGFADWAALLLATQQADLTPSEQRFARILHTFAVACVEQMNRETEIDPSPEAISEALSMWARAAGYTTMTATASVMKDAAPLRRIARTFAEEFKIGAKMAADACMRTEDPAHGR